VFGSGVTPQQHVQQICTVSTKPGSPDGATFGEKVTKLDFFANFEAHFLELQNTLTDQHLPRYTGEKVLPKGEKIARSDAQNSARGRQTWHISLAYNSKPEVEIKKFSMPFFTAHWGLKRVIYILRHLAPQVSETANVPRPQKI